MPIGVHVFGPGVGESIVLELPDGSIGIVDSFRPGKTRFPLLDFIVRHFHSRPVAFLVVTHPHSDHCAGAAELGRSLRVRECWAFDAVLSDGLRFFFSELNRLGGHDEVDRAMELPRATISLEVLRLRDFFIEGCSKGRLLRSPKRFPLCDGDVEVEVWTPGDQGCIDYSRNVARTIAAMSRDGRNLEPLDRPLSVHPNLISAALQFRYGNTRILLLADAEQPLWNDWSEDTPFSTHPVQFLKIGHHGSVSGYHEPLFRAVCTSQTVAALTPFSRSAAPLPSREGIEMLLRHTSEIYCTNRFDAADSTGLSWDGHNPVRVPPAWAAAMARRPSLRDLLSPPINPNANPARDATLPKTWEADCKNNPELLRLIHPRLRSAVPLLGKLPAENTYRFSAFFDDQGNEIVDRRFIGVGVGKLVV